MLIYITNILEISIEIEIDLQCTSLVQKIDIEINELYNAEEDFGNFFLMDQVFFESTTQ